MVLYFCCLSITSQVSSVTFFLLSLGRIYHKKDTFIVYFINSCHIAATKSTFRHMIRNNRSRVGPMYDLTTSSVSPLVSLLHEGMKKIMQKDTKTNTKKQDAWIPSICQ